MIEWAFSFSTSSRIASRAPSAGTETIARSTRSGSAATLGKHGIPSMAVSFGWTA